MGSVPIYLCFSWSGRTTCGGTGYAPSWAVKSVSAETKGNAAWGDGESPDIERECETWDWARTAGVSAAELRKALSDSAELNGRSGERRS